MFTIYDGRNTFYQWDLDRKLIVNDNTIKEVHFANCLCSDARKCETYTEGGLNVVDVPNELLTEYLDINVYAYDSGMTKHCATFGVVKRTKPADYIYTPTELKKWEELEQEIDNNEDKFTRWLTSTNERISAHLAEASEINLAINAEIDKTNENLNTAIEETNIKIEATNKAVDDVISSQSNTSRYYDYSYPSTKSTWSSEEILHRLSDASNWRYSNYNGKDCVEIKNCAPFSNLYFKTTDTTIPNISYFNLHYANRINLLQSNNQTNVFSASEINGLSTEACTVNGLTIKRASNNGYYISGTTTKAGAFTYGDITLEPGTYYVFSCYKKGKILSKNLYYQLYEVNEDGTIGEQLTKYIGHTTNTYTINLRNATAPKTVRARLYYDAGVEIPEQLFRAYIGEKDSVIELVCEEFKHSSAGTSLVNSYGSNANYFVYCFPISPKNFGINYRNDILGVIEELKTAIISLGGNV